MANVVFRLSSKRSGDKSELLVRFYASRVIDLRAHTRLFVPTELWNDKMQRLLIPRRVVTEDTIAATEIQSKIEELRTLILNEYTQTHDERGVTKSWLERIIDQFHNVDRHELTPLSAISAGSSSWRLTGRPRLFAFSMALRTKAASVKGMPSSVKLG